MVWPCSQGTGILKSWYMCPLSYLPSPCFEIPLGHRAMFRHWNWALSNIEDTCKNLRDGNKPRNYFLLMPNIVHTPATSYLVFCSLPSFLCMWGFYLLLFHSEIAEYPFPWCLESPRNLDAVIFEVLLFSIAFAFKQYNFLSQRTYRL